MSERTWAATRRRGHWETAASPWLVPGNPKKDSFREGHHDRQEDEERIVEAVDTTAMDAIRTRWRRPRRTRR